MIAVWSIVRMGIRRGLKGQGDSLSEVSRLHAAAPGLERSAFPGLPARALILPNRGAELLFLRLRDAGHDFQVTFQLIGSLLGVGRCQGRNRGVHLRVDLRPQIRVSLF
jgi:hypothetical protein